MASHLLCFVFPQKKKDDGADSVNLDKITWGTFITDSFSFINNELDAFFDHLVSFPSEGMSMADVMFERLQFLVETILHLTEMSMRDYYVNGNGGTKEDEEAKYSEVGGGTANGHGHHHHGANGHGHHGHHQSNGGHGVRKRKRKGSRNAVRSGVNEMERAMKGKVFGRQQRAKMVSDFTTNSPVTRPRDESVAKGQDILSKFELQMAGNKNVGRLQGLQSMAQFVSGGLAGSEETGLPDLQRIEDGQFDEELKILCVKFSSLSRAQEIINDLSGYLLQRIQVLLWFIDFFGD